MNTQKILRALVATVFVAGIFLVRLRAEDLAPHATLPVEATQAKISLLDRVIELNRIQEPELDANRMKTEFNALVERARNLTNQAQSARGKVALLNAALLYQGKQAFVSNIYWRDSTLAAGLLRKRGNCLSMSTLYVLVARELGLPVFMVLIPRHAFVRWDDGIERINIETTNGGTELSDDHYLNVMSQADPVDAAKFGWGQSLSDDELFADLLGVAGHHREGENKLEEAVKLYDQAIKLAPKRLDHVLSRLCAQADVTGKRDEAIQAMKKMIEPSSGTPPSIMTLSLMNLAHEAAAEGDHENERNYLVLAMARAPKTLRPSVMMELAFCMRARKEHKDALNFIQIAVNTDPGNPDYLYNKAILQRDTGDTYGALNTVQTARALNPESWYSKILEAGFLYSMGQTETGLRQFAEVQRPRGADEHWEIMQAWFLAVSKQREGFYKQLKIAMDKIRSTRLLEWIEEDIDLDVYRGEAEFKTLVAAHKKRILGK